MHNAQCIPCTLFISIIVNCSIETDFRNTKLFQRNPIANTWKPRMRDGTNICYFLNLETNIKSWFHVVEDWHKVDIEREREKRRKIYNENQLTHCHRLPMVLDEETKLLGFESHWMNIFTSLAFINSHYFSVLRKNQVESF